VLTRTRTGPACQVRSATGASSAGWSGWGSRRCTRA